MSIISPRVDVMEFLKGKITLNELKQLIKKSPTRQVVATTEARGIDSRVSVLSISTVAHHLGGFSSKDIHRIKSEKETPNLNTEAPTPMTWVRANFHMGSRKMPVLSSILQHETSRRDVAVAASVMAWLQTQEGAKLLAKMVATSPTLRSAIKEELSASNR